ncbi:MAG: hypothetical protein ACJAYC_002745 [Halieaceae bacterium]|jgi:hypothetical protein
MTKNTSRTKVKKVGELYVDEAGLIKRAKLKKKKKKKKKLRNTVENPGTNSVETPEPVKVRKPQKPPKPGLHPSSDEFVPRANDGRFLPGGASVKKRKNTRTILKSNATEEELDAVLRGLLDSALAGDAQDRRFIAEKLLPTNKATYAPVEFDMSGSTASEAAHDVLKAIAAGQLPADVGQSILASVKSVSDTALLDALSTRVAELEHLAGSISQGVGLNTPNQRPVLENEAQPTQSNVVDITPNKTPTDLNEDWRDGSEFH